MLQPGRSACVSMSLHPLNYFIGSVNIAVWLAFVGMVVMSVRQWKVHHIAASKQNRTSAVASFCIGQHRISLPTLLRGTVALCTLSGTFATFLATIAPFLQLEPQDESLADIPLIDPSYADLSIAGRVCLAFCKISPSGYVFSKAWSYLFFSLKARTVRPQECMTLLERISLGHVSPLSSRTKSISDFPSLRTR